MLFTQQINANSGDHAIPTQELAINHQHLQVLGNRPLHQPLQLQGRGCLPMPAHTGALDAVTLEATINGSLIVTRRALPGQLSGHSLLQLAAALKSLVAGQLNLLLSRTTQSGPLQTDLAT